MLSNFRKITSECWWRIPGTQKGSPISSKGGRTKYKRQKQRQKIYGWRLVLGRELWRRSSHIVGNPPTDMFVGSFGILVKVVRSCLTLCGPMDYIIHGILLARILEWVAFLFSRGSSQLWDRIQVSHIAARFFTKWATQEYWSGQLGISEGNVTGGKKKSTVRESIPR